MTATLLAFAIGVYLFITALATALASAAHGGNYLPKVAVVALHFLLAPLVAPPFWLFLRRGKQAQAEMNVIAGQGGLDAVKAAYPPGFGWLVAKAIGESRTRRSQELCGGFVIGLTLGVLTIPVIALCAQ